MFQFSRSLPTTQDQQVKPGFHTAGMVEDYVPDQLPTWSGILSEHMEGNTLSGSDADIADVQDRCRKS